MSAVTIRYTRRLFGHPAPGSVVTVERTPRIDAILAQGFAVEDVTTGVGTIVTSDDSVETPGTTSDEVEEPEPVDAE